MSTGARFGPELRRLRQAAGLSLTEFSAALNYDKGYLSKVERGDRSASTELARRCDAFLGANGELQRRSLPTRRCQAPRTATTSSSPPRWRPVLDHPDRSDGASPALAIASIVSRAMEVVRPEKPDRASYARYTLEGELGVLLPDRSGRVTAMAADVTLTLAPDDSERLRKLSDLRKDEEIWEYERQHERNMRRYLGVDMLKSPGSAVVWWLARHEDEIEKAVDMIGPLAQIAAAANDEDVPEPFRHLLIPPVSARSEATVGGSLWDGDGQGEGLLHREPRTGSSA